MADFRVRAFSVAAGIVALDRITKWMIERHVSFADDIKVIPGLFDIVHSENRGVAFGMFNESGSQWITGLIVALSAAAVIGMSLALARGRGVGQLTAWAYALLLGGAAGNLYDRAVAGRVTDFLLFYVGEHQWPSFNVADSAICVGVALMVIDGLLTRRETSI